MGGEQGGEFYRGATREALGNWLACFASYGIDDGGDNQWLAVARR